MSDSALISIVQQYEELYNLQNSEYSNQQRRDNIWEEIGEQLSENSIKCKERWQRIRENFRKAMHLRKTKSGQSADRLKPPKYYQELSFLTPYLTDDENRASNISRTRTRLSPSPHSGMDSPGGDSQHSDSSLCNISRRTRTPTQNPRYTPYTPTTSTSLQVPTVASVFKEYVSKTTANSNSNSDPLVDFFITMAKTVKRFPLKKQLGIKSALFQMVHNVEIEMSNEETSFRLTLPEITTTPSSSSAESRLPRHYSNRTDNESYQIIPGSPQPIDTNIGSLSSTESRLPRHYSNRTDSESYQIIPGTPQPIDTNIGSLSSTESQLPRHYSNRTKNESYQIIPGSPQPINTNIGSLSSTESRLPRHYSNRTENESYQIIPGSPQTIDSNNDSELSQIIEVTASGSKGFINEYLLFRK